MIWAGEHTGANTAGECGKTKALVSLVSGLILGRTEICWDHSVAKSFFTSLENEMYHHQGFLTRAQARFAVAGYIEIFYNRKRRHSSLEYQTPASRALFFAW